MAHPNLTLSREDFDRLSDSQFASELRDSQPESPDQATVRVGDSVYSVRIRDNKVAVKRSLRFSNLWNTDRSEEIRQKLADSVNVRPVSEGAAKALARARQPNAFAGEGLRAERPAEDSPARVRGITTADYNTQSGVVPAGGFAAGLDALIESLKAGTLRNAPDKSAPIAPEKLDAWKAFLRDNADRIDIYARIASFLREGAAGARATGWAGLVQKFGADHALRSFVRKHIPFEILQSLKWKGAGTLNAVVATVSEALKELVALHERNGKVTAEDIARLGIGARDVEGYSLEFLLNSVLGTAFFRQTGKLGLEFSRRDRLPASFRWSGHKARRSGPSKPQSQWWKKTPAGTGEPAAEAAPRPAQHSPRKEPHATIPKVHGDKN